ncbi:MAG: NF038122 family metalloprotease [Acidobacteriota bacterium]
MANLIIVPTFDTATFGTLSAANQASVKNTINSVIATYETNILDSITVHITFDIDQSVLGSTSFSVYQIPYSSFVAALTSHALSADDFTALANLSSSATLDPVAGKASIDVKAPLVRALGIDNFGANNTTLDATISLGTNQMNLSRDGTQNPGYYDLQSVVSHEIDEALGLGSSLGLGLSYISPEDLFRYTGTSAACTTTSGRSYSLLSSAIACFSINGSNGLVRFNQPGNSQSDYGDWAVSSTIRVQDAFATPGAQLNLGPLEWEALDVIGYSLVSPTPEPATGLLFAAGCGAVVWWRRMRKITA